MTRGFEEYRCTPWTQWRRSVLLRAAAGPLTAVLIRSAADLSPIAEELTPAGQPSGRRCAYPSSHLRPPLDGAAVRRHPLLQLYGTRCTQLPLIENSFSGCQGHPPLCLPPRTAQRLPDRIQTMFGRAVFIQLTVVGDINAKAVEA